MSIVETPQSQIALWKKKLRQGRPGRAAMQSTQPKEEVKGLRQKKKGSTPTFLQKIEYIVRNGKGDWDR